MLEFRNHVELCGRIERTTEVRFTAKGRPRAAFSIYTLSGAHWKTWHRIVVFDEELIEVVRNLPTEKWVEIVGSLQVRSWGTEGAKQYITEIRASAISVLEEV